MRELSFLSLLVSIKGREEVLEVFSKTIKFFPNLRGCREFSNASRAFSSTPYSSTFLEVMDFARLCESIVTDTFGSIWLWYSGFLIRANSGFTMMLKCSLRIREVSSLLPSIAFSAYFYTWMVCLAQNCRFLNRLIDTCEIGVALYGSPAFGLMTCSRSFPLCDSGTMY